ncbi:phosphopentomutase [Mesorhizobium sp. CAU 1741]|uniref:phosphopentomutase n=1 Tax=Mesorhizobium sp. CAU 1741 TaxID=3140366 RepID=UPI00325BD5D1
MARAFLFVLDSFGIGGAPDAARFGDEGADTFGHIDAECARGNGDRAGLRAGRLHLPNMRSLGLWHAGALATGRAMPHGAVTGFFGAATETSSGKDTPSGHWEIAGLPVDFEWGYFPDTQPAFPAAFTQALIREAGLPGILANCHASGVEVIERFGEEHVRTGKPICYTSADSVIQIAAHETDFGLERLYELCRIGRRLADPLNVGRVIARPFIGETVDTFERTPNRKDFATPPPEATLLDRLTEAGHQVLAVGKIGDIFAHRGISNLRKAPNNMAMFDAALTAMDDAGAGDFVFANFVDFDTNFGHRRDVAGYAAALEAFDARLPEALAKLREGDMLMLTADHGCDPTWKGTDHTRERVPVIGTGPGLKVGPVGVRQSFADIGETVAEHLGIAPGRHGTSFRRQLAADA